MHVTINHLSIFSTCKVLLSHSENFTNKACIFLRFDTAGMTFSSFNVYVAPGSVSSFTYIALYNVTVRVM